MLRDLLRANADKSEVEIQLPNQEHSFPSSSKCYGSHSPSTVRGVHVVYYSLFFLFTIIIIIYFSKYLFSFRVGVLSSIIRLSNKNHFTVFIFLLFRGYSFENNLLIT